MKTSLIHTLMAVTLTCAVCAQSPADSSPDKAAIEANARAFEAAYGKGDAKAIADLFTEDAAYTSDDGKILTSREAIAELLQSVFAGRKGAKLAINIESIRNLAPEVAVEKGDSSVTAKDGEVTGALYTAVHVKKDGKWKISELVETPLPDPTPHDRLSELAWLVGAWEEADKANDLSVQSEYVWARGNNFLTRNVTVKQAGNTTLEGWQIIGWDPLEERIRSWTFDSAGGFSDGRWTRDGDRWLLREAGVAADGSRTSADNTFNKLSDDKFTWESNNRLLDGEPQPSISKIEINRVKGR